MISWWKRLFDLLGGVPATILTAPLLVVCALAIWVTDGRPVFYVSTRRVHGTRSIRLLKFRTMVRNADRIANRETIPFAGRRFLNIRSDSPLYTRVGRMIERFHLTELPQLWHVLRGDMSLVGNRPLPVNVIRALREVYPWAEERFRTKAGLTGPVQLIGRDAISDKDRLLLERDYCYVCETAYSMRFDLLVLGWTVLVALGLRRGFTVAEMYALMHRCSGISDPFPGEGQGVAGLGSIDG